MPDVALNNYTAFDSRAPQPAFPYQETAELPVLSRNLIDQWDRAGLDSLASRTRISHSAAALGPDDILSDELRVWNRGLTPGVVQFRQRGLAIFEEFVVYNFHDYLGPFKAIKLGQNAGGSYLMGCVAAGAPERIRPADISRLYLHRDMPSSASDAFGAYMVEGITETLSYLPKNKYMTLDPDPKFFYEDDKLPFSSQHIDEKPHEDFDNFLTHISDPGSPFIDQAMFRTAESHFSWHGRRFSHGLATAKPVEGHKKLRICFALQVRNG